MKNFKAIYYICAIFVVGLVSLIYLSLGQSEKTIPKIKLSYFKNNSEFVTSAGSILQQELINQKYFWFGIEPGHENQINFFIHLKKHIEQTHGVFDLVIIDQELNLTVENQNLFQATKLTFIKQNWFELSKLIKENSDKKILVITAAIYSTNMIKQNPIDKIKTDSLLNPMTFSMGYFAGNTLEEKNNIFPCVTDDKEGIAAWGCLVVNKARAQRRKLDVRKISSPENLIAGFMDLTGEKDYLILMR